MNKKAFHTFITTFFVSMFLFISSFSYSQSETPIRFLPKPTGNFQVGTTELFITDSSRKERFKKRDFRRVYIKIWYPAVPKANQKPELYLQNYSAELINGIFQSKDFSFEWLNEIKKSYTYSYTQAPVQSSDFKYPVIIFTPGYYFGLAELYSAYMEELASHGYIVCSVNHLYEQPYIKFPDGEEVFIKKKRTQWAYLQLVMANWFQFRDKDSHENIERITRYYHKMLHRFRKALDYWVDDTRFFVDYLYQQKAINQPNEVIQAMDLEKIGAFGQSFGGAVTGQLCLLDERVKAGLNMDCFQFGDVIDHPLMQPFLLIQSDYQPTWNMGNTINYENHKGEFSLLSLANASHFVFSDGAVLPYDTKEFENRMIGDIDGELLLRKTNDYMLDFFDHHLKGKDAILIYENVKDSIIEYKFEKGEE